MHRCLLCILSPTILQSRPKCQPVQLSGQSEPHIPQQEYTPMLLVQFPYRACSSQRRYHVFGHRMMASDQVIESLLLKLIDDSPDFHRCHSVQYSTTLLRWMHSIKHMFITLHHTCQLLRIFRKLYGIFVILRAYGRRGISLRIFIFTKSLIFLRLICSFCYGASREACSRQAYPRSLPEV